MGTITPDKLEPIKKLYYVEGLSAREIACALNVSIDAVYFFMRKFKLKRRSYEEEQAMRFSRKPLSYTLKIQLSEEEKELKTMGVVLYWGEGYKASTALGVDFANSDPLMVVTFLQFLRKICGVNEKKLRVFLYCYKNHSPRALIRYWSKLTGIPTMQFTKPYVRKDFRVEKTGKMRYGVVHIRYHDKKLLEQIRAWIEEYKKKFAPVA